jgi:hypothetical protein
MREETGSNGHCNVIIAMALGNVVMCAVPASAREVSFDLKAHPARGLPSVQFGPKAPESDAVDDLPTTEEITNGLFLAEDAKRASRDHSGGPGGKKWFAVSGGQDLSPDSTSEPPGPSDGASLPNPSNHPAQRKQEMGAEFEKNARYRASALHWEWAYQVMNMADAFTTYECLKHPYCHEGNPILGKRPSPGVLFGSRAAIGIAHYFAMRAMAREHPQLARTTTIVTFLIESTVAGINIKNTFR